MKTVENIKLPLNKTNEFKKFLPYEADESEQYYKFAKARKNKLCL